MRPERLILDDAEDALQRKVVRMELNTEGDLIYLDLPKRYAGHSLGNTRFTDPTRVRCLDKEGVLYLMAWLSEAAEHLR